MSQTVLRAHVVRKAVEWPTVFLAVFIYGSWGCLTYFHDSIPLWLLVPLGAWFVAWQTSLQHEVIHGHPTRKRWLNKMIGGLPLLLWLPYDCYRMHHLIHHRDERLTDPLDDPESGYMTPEGWAKLSPLRRFIIRVNSTFLGRLTIGPGWMIYRYLTGEARLLLAGDPVHLRIWASHILPLVIVLTWLIVICKMNMLLYFAGFVYPGVALMSIRSYAEHRAESSVEERTAIVENAPILGLLFLYNNLHVVHHNNPSMPWYEIPGWYAANREALIAQNGGLVYNSYWDIARRFLLKPHDVPVHPFGRAPPAMKPV